MKLETWLNRLSETHSKLKYVLLGNSPTHKTEALFVCDKHGPFVSTVFNVCRSKHGCPECARESSNEHKRKEYDHFLSIINQSNKLNQELKIPDDLHSLSYIRVKCETHGWFRISINSFKTGSNCTKCGTEACASKQYGKPKRVRI